MRTERREGGKKERKGKEVSKNERNNRVRQKERK